MKIFRTEPEALGVKDLPLFLSLVHLAGNLEKKSLFLHLITKMETQSNVILVH